MARNVSFAKTERISKMRGHISASLGRHKPLRAAVHKAWLVNIARNKSFASLKSTTVTLSGANEGDGEYTFIDQGLNSYWSNQTTGFSIEENGSQWRIKGYAEEGEIDSTGGAGYPNDPWLSTWPEGITFTPHKRIFQTIPISKVTFG